MSDWLRESLQETCVAHGVPARIDGERVHIQDDLVIEPRVFARERPGGPVQVQVDFDVVSPRLGNLPFVDSLAGVGASVEEAQRNAMGKFLAGSMHVILEALVSHTGTPGEEQVEWEDWSGNSASWRVCSGPLLMLATRHDARIDGYPEFFAALTARFGASFPAGPHWMRIFVGALDGANVGSEVLVDGEPWPQGQELVGGHAWAYPPGYASLRHLLILLPKDG